MTTPIPHHERSDQPGLPYELSDESPTVAARMARILDVAAGCFAASGVAGTGVREIAAACGIKSGALYNYFASKEQMVNLIIAAYLTELADQSEVAAGRSTDAREQYRELVRVAVDSMTVRRHACTLYQNEAVYLESDPAYSKVVTLAGRVQRVWLTVIQNGADAGIFRSDVSPELMYRLSRDGIWSAVRWYRTGGRLSPTELAEAYAAVLLDGMQADSRPHDADA